MKSINEEDKRMGCWSLDLLILPSNLAKSIACSTI